MAASSYSYSTRRIFRVRHGPVIRLAGEDATECAKQEFRRAEAGIIENAGPRIWRFLPCLRKEGFLGIIEDNRLTHEKAFLPKIRNSATRPLSGLRKELSKCYASRRGAR